jgi:hypothetical protein
MVQAGVRVMELSVIPFFDLPLDLQRLVLGRVPLRALAKVAWLNKQLCKVYLDRVKVRDASVASLLQSHFTAAFRDGLLVMETALPRDLIVDPQVRPLPSAPCSNKPVL